MFSSYNVFFDYILTLFPDEPIYYSWSLSTDKKKATYYFYKQPAITLKLSGKLQYMEIADFFEKDPQEMSAECSLNDKKETVRYSLERCNNPLELTPLIQNIDAYYRRNASVETFGCCNDFIQCSDAKKCLHPNDYFYLGCLYRSNLEFGRIFYGENRNV